EAEFYMAQGLWDEALETLSDALATHPNHPLILDKLEELAEAQAAPPRESAPPDAALDAMSDDESFALAEKLAEELDGGGPEASNDVLDLDHLFSQFKRGVEQQIDASDSETHYDLGIAYKEMGLIDDAISEFRLAMSNPDRECIAETMIGMCHLERGRVHEAIEHFKNGLGSSRKSAREELGLYYEIGSAYELLSEADDALAYFEKVRAHDPGFRGVSERMRKLTEMRGASSPASTSRDDVDRAFDDLFGDD
ncbi:MAG: tetratricopeptide repeat protein, partial [Polyangiaceae bacterium]|nr:tetratricopeptide repeat protein [Polyangiaceae bacterium]